MHHEFLRSLFGKTARLIPASLAKSNVVKDNWTELHSPRVIVIRSLDHVSIDRARDVQSALRTQNQDIHLRVGSTSFPAKKCPQHCSNLTQSIQSIELKI